MGRVLALWVVVFAVAAVGAGATYVRCPGCIARDRVNTACQWTGDAAFPLDPRDPAHRAHLAGDAHLAEELAIRYADAEHGRRFGVGHHGGLLEGGRVRQRCLSQMLHAIESAHGVTSDRIQVARGQRNGTYDVAVTLLFLPFYALAAALAARSLRRRFSTRDRAMRWATTGLTSVAAALLGSQAFRLWGGVWEAIRVGNGHMAGIRAASSSHWLKQYGGADIFCGFLIFWLVALICYRALAEDEHVPDSRAPFGVPLR